MGNQGITLWFLLFNPTNDFLPTELNILKLHLPLNQLFQIT
jgi:hypothetical protein